MALPSRRPGAVNLFSPSRGRRVAVHPAAQARAAQAPAAQAQPADACVERLEPRQLMAAQPTAQLVNAATDRVIGAMYNGMTIDLSKVGRRLNILGTPSGSAGSLQFKIDGKAVKTESFAPYTIGGDAGADFFDWTPPTGTHTLQVVQWSKANATGAVQGTTTLSFTAVSSPPAAPPAVPPPPPVVSPPTVPLGLGPTVDLYNSATGAKVVTLKTGYIVDMDRTGTKLNLLATPAASGGSVVFRLNNQALRTDSSAPFTVAGESATDFSDWTPPVGTHQFQAVHYAGANGTGAVLGLTSMVLTVLAPVGTTVPPVTSPPPPPPPVVVPPVPPPPVVVPPPVSPPPVVVPPAPPPPPVVASPVPAGLAPNGGTPTPVIKVVGQVGVVGHPVVVNAANSSLPNSPIMANYQWDFGDPAGAYNQLPGWTAGHVYDRPGTYTVNLTLTDGNGQSAHASTTITVTPENRRVVYVDAAAGNDNNAGTAGAPIRSFARAAALAKSANTKVLFRRGQSWNTNAVMAITAANVHVGAFGDGANPVINITGQKVAIQTFSGASHVVIEGLTFDTPHKPAGQVANKTGVSAIFTGGTGIAVRDCTFLNVDDAVNANQNPNGLIVMDNDAPLVTGLRAYLLWAQGTDVVAVGNYAANSTREHIIRAADANRLLVAYNDFANPKRPGLDNADIDKGTIEMQRGGWAYIYGNTTRDGPVRVGPRGEATEPSSTKTSYAVIENNRISNYQVNVNPGTHHLAIRNNQITVNGNAGIRIMPSDPQGRNVSNVFIFDNVGYNSASEGRFLRVEGGMAARAVTLARNRYVAPNLAVGGNDTVAVSVSASDLSGFRAIFDNVWPVPRSISKYAQGGLMWVYGNYSGQVGYKDATEWLAYPEVTGDVFRN